MAPSRTICKNRINSWILHSFNSIRIREYNNFKKHRSPNSKISISTCSTKFPMAFIINKTSNMSRRSWISKCFISNNSSRWFSSNRWLRYISSNLTKICMVEAWCPWSLNHWNYKKRTRIHLQTRTFWIYCWCHSLLVEEARMIASGTTKTHTDTLEGPSISHRWPSGMTSDTSRTI
jgi:hypothetical protein